MLEEKVVCRVGLLVHVMLAIGCRAHAQAGAQVNGSIDTDDRKYEVPETELPASPSPAAAPASLPERTPAPTGEPPVDRAHFVGVVHDLTLAPAAQRNAACQCLAIEVGTPADPKFAWQAGAPRADAGTLAIAVAADGVGCAAPGYSSQLASIAAVQNEGNDLVIVMENVREGAPVVRGALVFPPGPAGALVVRARGAVPYGAPVAGGPGPCRLKI